MSLGDDILDLICTTFDVKKEELKPNTTLYDSLGVDSTEMVELRVAINKKFGVNIEQGEITNKHTPSNIIEVIERKKQ